MSGLDELQRGRLERIVVRGRSTFESDLETTLRGTYGIHPDGTSDPAESLADEPAIRTSRAVFDEILRHLRAAGATEGQAVERFVREAAFTHLNRLIAIRVADSIGVLQPSLRDGNASSGFKQFLEVAPLLATSTLDDTGGYWTYLQRCADELAADAPALFDPRNPLLVLRPSKSAIDAIVDLLSDPSTAEIWAGDDTFGWAYQFFNTGEERKEMRKESAAPRDSRELAVRNQFFTPSYVVRFLVQNTLGRRLIDADPSSPLLDELPLLVNPPTTAGEPLDLSEAKVLDPASGSGHFLLGCYDVLEAAWRLQGVDAATAAPKIVPCLWGVDIDPRAVQVAQAAVIFRARRACGRAPLPPPNIVCATSLPDDRAAWETATASLDPALRTLLYSLRDALRDAPVLGSLLKVEQRLATEIRSAVPFADETDEGLLVTAGVARDNFGKAERAVLTALQSAADSTLATAAEQLLAAQTGDAVRFVEACRNRYDAVLMNPPFGEAVPSTKEYLKAAYPWIPTKDYNLLAAFVGRGIELCNPSGYMGAITSRAGLFIKTFEDWRSQVLLGHRLEALADFGYGVMEQAMVEAAAYVVSPKRPSADHAAAFIRLLKDADRPAALASAISADREGREDSRVFRVASEEFRAIPGSPMSYWTGNAIRALFRDLPRLEGNGAEARQGLASGDDFRFLRLFWEVDPRSVGRSRDETHTGRRWVPFAKGGEYSPFWADIHLVLEWERDGFAVRGYSGARPQNTQYFFRQGLTWPSRTQGGFGLRVLPSGVAFGHKGPAIITTSDEDALVHLGAIMSRPALFAIGAMATFGSYEVGVIQKTPAVGAKLGPADRVVAAQLMREVVEVVAGRDQLDETTRNFVHPGAMEATVRASYKSDREHRLPRSVHALDALRRLEALFDGILGLGDAAQSFLDDELGTPPWIEQPLPLAPDEHAASPLGPFLVDRELEKTARGLQVHCSIAAEQLLTQTPSSEQLIECAESRISWLLGCAFGRWDVRPVDRPEFDPFWQPPLCPPGALLDADGFPLTVAPAAYPLALPPDAILVDQIDHGLDIAVAVERAAVAAAEYGADLLADAVRTLGQRSLRELLAKQFFKSHLSRYSKSRRQAPVYWQLVVPSGAWSLWLYAPRFSREMIFATATIVEQRIADGHERIRSILADPSSTARQQAKDAEAERTLIAQLGDLLADLRRIAGLGWQPDLNDGYVLNAAPLAKWFPKNAWKQLADELKNIKKGEYPWSTIHQFREGL